MKPIVDDPFCTPPLSVSDGLRAFFEAVKIGPGGSLRADEKAIATLFSLLPDSTTSKSDLKSMRAWLSHGVVMRKGDDAKKIQVPWGYIVGAAQDPLWRVPAEVRTFLGLDRIKSVDAARDQLMRRFTPLPDPLRDEELIGRLLRAAPRMAGVGGSDIPPEVKVKLPGYTPVDYGPTSPPAIQDVEIEDVLKCLREGSWRATWYGVSVCLGSDCADTMARAVEKYMLLGRLADLAGALASVVFEALKYGTSSPVGAFIQLAIILKGAALFINLSTANLESHGRGVCLVWHWPYLPILGGQLWAYRR